MGGIFHIHVTGFRPPCRNDELKNLRIKFQVIVREIRSSDYVVFISKRRKKVLYEPIRKHLGEKFWARGYFVSTIGLGEEVVRAYVRHQYVENNCYEQMKLLT